MVAVIINEMNNVNKAINPYTGKVYDRSALLLAHPEPDRGVRLVRYEDHGHLIVLLVGLVFTFFWSALDVLASGKYARKPFCFIPRLDDVDEEVPLVKDSDEKKDGLARGPVLPS